MKHHYRFLSAFLTAIQTPIGVLCGVEIAANNWLLVAATVGIITVVEALSVAILDKMGDEK